MITVEQRLEKIEKQLDKLTYASLEINCIRCEHFDKKKEICGLFNLRPPATTIVRGCENFLLDIPF